MAVVGPGATISDIRALHGSDAPWRLRIELRTGVIDVVLRAPTARITAGMVATGAEALDVAERHGLPAPRLIGADLEGDATGMPVTLETLLPGATRWLAPASEERLRASGALLARIHSVAITATDRLPFRARPIAVDDFAAVRRQGWMPTTPLLQAADEIATAHGLPATDRVFVHGDVWPGNIVWSADERAALIDWKTAGVGAPGVDLGELRKQVAIVFGREASGFVLEEWECAMGTKADDIGYWDVVAALNTPTEVHYVNISAATERRDDFLRAALRALDRRHR